MYNGRNLTVPPAGDSPSPPLEERVGERRPSRRPPAAVCQRICAPLPDALPAPRWRGEGETPVAVSKCARAPGLASSSRKPLVPGRAGSPWLAAECPPSLTRFPKPAQTRESRHPPVCRKPGLYYEVRRRRKALRRVPREAPMYARRLSHVSPRPQQSVWLIQLRQQRCGQE